MSEFLTGRHLANQMLYYNGEYVKGADLECVEYVKARVGFNLIEDTIRIMEDGNVVSVKRAQFYHYGKPYIFMRDVDVEPIVLESESVFDKLNESFTMC